MNFFLPCNTPLATGLEKEMKTIKFVNKINQKLILKKYDKKIEMIIEKRKIIIAILNPFFNDLFIKNFIFLFSCLTLSLEVSLVIIF